MFPSTPCCAGRSTGRRSPGFPWAGGASGIPLHPPGGYFFSEVYFGATPAVERVSWGVNQHVFDPGARLAENSDYFWQVRLWYPPSGGFVVTPLFTFRTGEGLSTLAQPSHPSPASNAVHVWPATLTWISPDATSWDLYMGPDAAHLALVAAGLAEPSYALSGLTHDSAVWWQVVAHLDALSSTSPVWSFTTGTRPAAPAGFLQLFLNAGTGVDTGVHGYAYTVVKSTGGESLPSPTSSIWVAPTVAPTPAPTATAYPMSPSSLVVGSRYRWRVTLWDPHNGWETDAGPASDAYVPSDQRVVTLHLPGSPAGAVLLDWRFYRSVNEGAYHYEAYYTATQTTANVGFGLDATIAANPGPPAGNGFPPTNAVKVMGLAAGTGVIARRLVSHDGRGRAAEARRRDPRRGDADLHRHGARRGARRRRARVRRT